jgi:iron complex outermembrane receptor protein
MISASVAALSFSGLMAPAHAADADVSAPAADAGQTIGLSEVIVTAQKRSENVQKVPVSISVLSAQGLADSHIQSLGDLENGGIPSLHVVPFASRPFSVILNIRGVGLLSDANQPARDQGTGVYVDGVYLGRPQGLNAALYDIESLEVLKGPQGTLFGRNTEAGAVNITTKKPTGQFHFDAGGSVGNFGSYTTEAHLDTAEYNNFSVKVDGLVEARDGTVKNPMVGASDFGAYSRRGLRAQLQWRPMANLTVNYAYDTGHDSETTLYQSVVSAGTSPVAPLLAIHPDRVDVAPVGVPEAPSIGVQSGHTVTAKWVATPALTIKSISSYRDLTQNQFDNSAVDTAVFTPNGAFSRYSLAKFDQFQYSEELQAIGQVDRLKYVVGALAFHEHTNDQAQAFNTLQFNSTGTAATLISYGPNNLVNNYGAPITTVVNPLFPYAGVDRASRASTTSYGVYGQATYTPPIFEDRLHVTGGGRWTDDLKRGELILTNNAPPVNQFGQSGALGFDKSWSRFDPMVNAAFDVTSNAEVYGKWSTGYRSGGANSRSLDYKPFNPETVSMFEVGLKSELFDHRARFNIAGYAGTYKDIQIDFSAPYYTFGANGQPLPGSTTRTTTETFNAPGTGKLHGIETEFMVIPVEGLTIAANYAWNYVHIPAVVNPYPTYVPNVGEVYSTTAVAQNQVYTPEHAVSLSSDYVRPIIDYTMRLHLDGNWDSGSYGSTTAYVAPGVPQIKSQSGLTVNGRIELAGIQLAPNAKMTVALWSRNLLDKQYLYTRSYSITGGVSGVFNTPREFGLEGKLKF